MSLSPITPAPSSDPTSAVAGADASPFVGSPPPAAEATAAAAPLPGPLSAMLAEAATLQDSLAPLLADLAVAIQSPALPEAARTTALQLLAAQTPLDGEATAQTLQAAVRNSGVFLEASLAAALQVGAEPPDMQGDLKALLLRLVRDLGAEPAGVHDAEAEAAQARHLADLPPPPLAGAALAGQPAAKATLGPQTSLATLVHTLHAEAEASLARLQLSQSASLAKAETRSHWSFEAPVATPAGTAMAQFEINRDGHGASPDGAAAEPTWRARFSLNVAPSGPIHVELALGGGRTHVRLIAQDAAARAALAASQDELAQALVSEESADVIVRVTAAAPPRPPPAPGQLLDRRS